MTPAMCLATVKLGADAGLIHAGESHTLQDTSDDASAPADEAHSGGDTATAQEWWRWDVAGERLHVRE
jgi:hypothetical protein